MTDLGPLALEPGYESPFESLLGKASERYHYGKGGNALGEEVIYQKDDEETTDYQTFDTAGRSTLDEVWPAGLTIEGPDKSSGASVFVAERDRHYRPTKVVGITVDQPSGLGAEIYDAVNQSVGIEDNGDPDIGEIHTTQFEYDQDGLLVETIASVTYGEMQESERHRNYYDDEGKRIGYKKTKWREIEGGIAEPEIVDTVKFFSEEGDYYKSIAYMSVGGLLMPHYFDYDADRPHRGYKYLIPMMRSHDLYPYLLQKFDYIPLEQMDPLAGTEDRIPARDMPSVLHLPACLDPERIDDALEGHMSIDSAIFEIDREQLKDVRILNYEEAIASVQEEVSNESSLVSFVENLADKRIVVLGGPDSKSYQPLIELHQDLKYFPGRMDTMQRFAALCAASSVFARERIDDSAWMARQANESEKDLLLKILHLNQSDMSQVYDRIASDLSQEATARVDYLMQLQPRHPNQ